MPRHADPHAHPDLTRHMNAMYLLSDPQSGENRTSFSIGDLAHEFDLTLRALRFYEARGLIAPKRRGQVRRYSRRDRARLKLILMGKSVGFSLNEIKEMLDFYDLGDGQITQLKVCKSKCEHQLLSLKKQRAELDDAITELNRARNIITNLLASKQGQSSNLLPFTLC